MKGVWTSPSQIAIEEKKSRSFPENSIKMYKISDELIKWVTSYHARRASLKQWIIELILIKFPLLKDMVMKSERKKNDIVIIHGEISNGMKLKRGFIDLSLNESIHNIFSFLIFLHISSWFSTSFGVE